MPIANIPKVRQGLKKARSLLLEPYYYFRLELPADLIGRAMTDVQKMNGSFEPPQIDGDSAVLTGSAPVAKMQNYQTQVAAYAKGRGRLFCTMKGYEPCHNAEEVIEAAAYDDESDLENPCGSVFCSHGAGFVVPWYEVENYMHLESSVKMEDGQEGQQADRAEPGWTGNLGRESGRIITSGALGATGNEKKTAKGVKDYSGSLESDKELEEIFRRTFGESKRTAIILFFPGKN